ncbi:hypothetical protein ACN28C_30860 [Plantactinospora sp. WMMC1484]|uniref:hypothetical protein n=1 Tax=Plantactinospora sp. WMMC1484 TaxID=3404122 RepID=UPI003BF5FEF7
MLGFFVKGVGADPPKPARDLSLATVVYGRNAHELGVDALPPSANDDPSADPNPARPLHPQRETGSTSRTAR